jgi:hypothetical protein
MTWSGASAVALAAALLAAAPARAACTKDADCDPGKVCSLGKCIAKKAGGGTSSKEVPTAVPGKGETTPDTSSTAGQGTKSSPRFAWGGIGFYSVGFSQNFGFGTVSGSSGAFGLNVGAAFNVFQLTPDLPLAAFGQASIAFASGGSFFPLTAGAAVRYDKLPVQLLGGLGFTLMPNSGGANTGVGLALMAMGLYPLPQITPNFSAQVQLGYHILNQGLSLFQFTFGGGYAF